MQADVPKRDNSEMNKRGNLERKCNRKQYIKKNKKKIKKKKSKNMFDKWEEAGAEEEEGEEEEPPHEWWEPFSWQEPHRFPIFPMTNLMVDAISTRDSTRTST